MIDLHTHILPNIDDGAKSVEGASAMLRAELAQGVDTLVLTPHYYGKSHSPAQFLSRRQEAFSKLRECIPEGMQIRLGAEVHFTGVNMPDFDELTKLAIEGTRYILLELPFTERWSNGLLGALRDFVYETGYAPIIAHVERYAEVWKTPSLVNILIEAGCLIQVNAGSFLRGKDSRLPYALLKRGLVHCIATDCHDMGVRAPNGQEAKEAVERAGYAAEWANAQNIARKVLAGE